MSRESGVVAGTNLAGLAEAWEAQSGLRSRYREHRRLFQKTGCPDDFDPPTHVKEAALNHKVLRPLAQLMAKNRDTDGNIQLFSISQLEAETHDCS